MSAHERMCATELQYQDLSGLDFRGSNMALCSFADADLTGATWDNARGELFDELDDLRQAKASFDEVDAERAKQEDRADGLESERANLAEQLSEATLALEDARARIADLERAHDEALEATS